MRNASGMFSSFIYTAQNTNIKPSGAELAMCRRDILCVRFSLWPPTSNNSNSQLHPKALCLLQRLRRQTEEKNDRDVSLSTGWPEHRQSVMVELWLQFQIEGNSSCHLIWLHNRKASCWNLSLFLLFVNDFFFMLVLQRKLTHATQCRTLYSNTITRTVQRLQKFASVLNLKAVHAAKI